MPATPHPRSRTSTALAALGLLAIAPAGACLPDDAGPELGEVTSAGFTEDFTSTISITNHGETYERVVGVNVTHAWDAEKLGPVADLGALEPRTFLGVTGRQPGELFVFSYSHAEDLTPGAPPPWWPVPLTSNVIQVATVGTAPVRTTTQRTLRMPVMSARFVDHGACYTPVRLTPTSIRHPDVEDEAEPVFKLIADRILAEMRKNGSDITEQSVAFQASFMIPPGTSPYATLWNDDGFSFRGNYKGCAVFLGITFCAEFQLGATYAVRTVDGFAAFELIGDPELHNVPSNRRSNAAHVLGKGTTGGCARPGTSTPDFGQPCTNDWQCGAGRCLGVPLPLQLREEMLKRVIYPDPRTGSVGTALPETCELGAAGDAECRAKGPGLLAAGFMSTGGDAETAKFIATNLKPESFVCRPPIGQPDARYTGNCFYRPYFQRVNVTPDSLEAVWFNSHDVVGESPNTADYAFVRRYAPKQAPQCGADYSYKGPTGIPVYARGK